MTEPESSLNSEWGLAMTSYPLVIGSRDKADLFAYASCSSHVGSSSHSVHLQRSWRSLWREQSDQPQGYPSLSNTPARDILSPGWSCRLLPHRLACSVVAWSPWSQLRSEVSTQRFSSASTRSTRHCGAVNGTGPPCSRTRLASASLPSTIRWKPPTTSRQSSSV